MTSNLPSQGGLGSSKMHQIVELLKSESTSKSTRILAGRQLAELLQLAPHSTFSIVRLLEPLFSNESWDVRIGAHDALQLMVRALPTWRPDEPPSAAFAAASKKSHVDEKRLSQLNIPELLGAPHLLATGTQKDAAPPSQQTNPAKQFGISDSEDSVTKAREAVASLEAELKLVSPRVAQGIKRKLTVAQAELKAALAQLPAATSSTSVHPPIKSDPIAQTQIVVAPVAQTDPTIEWDNLVEWPWTALANSFLNMLDSPVWTQRHGAALGLRAILSGDASGAGRIKWRNENQQLPFVEEYRRISSQGTRISYQDHLNSRWIENAVCVMISVIIRERFADFIGDTMVAPVAETIAQGIGALLRKADSPLLFSMLSIVSKLQAAPSWNVRHTSLLVSQYLAAAQKPSVELFKAIAPSAIRGLSDSSEDVRVVAARVILAQISSLVQAEDSLIQQFLDKLWNTLTHAQADDESGSDLDSNEELLNSSDDSASTGAVLEVLAQFYTNPNALKWMNDPAMQSRALSLLNVLSHTLSSVRVSALQTIERLFVNNHEFSWITPSLVAQVFVSVMKVVLVDGNEKVASLASSLTSKLSSYLHRATFAQMHSLIFHQLVSWSKYIITPYDSTLPRKFLAVSQRRASSSPDTPLSSDLIAMTPELHVRAVKALSPIFFALTLDEPEIQSVCQAFRQQSMAASTLISLSLILACEWHFTSPPQALWRSLQKLHTQLAEQMKHSDLSNLIEIRTSNQHLEADKDVFFKSLLSLTPQANPSSMLQQSHWESFLQSHQAVLSKSVIEGLETRRIRVLRRMTTQSTRINYYRTILDGLCALTNISPSSVDCVTSFSEALRWIGLEREESLQEFAISCLVKWQAYSFEDMFTHQSQQYKAQERFIMVLEEWIKLDLGHIESVTSKSPVPSSSTKKRTAASSSSNNSKKKPRLVAEQQDSVPLNIDELVPEESDVPTAPRAAQMFLKTAALQLKEQLFTAFPSIRSRFFDYFLTIPSCGINDMPSLRAWELLLPYLDPSLGEMVASLFSHLVSMIVTLTSTSLNRFEFVLSLACVHFPTKCMPILIMDMVPILDDLTLHYPRLLVAAILERIISSLDTSVIAWAVLLALPLMSRMSDPEPEVRVAIAHSFAALLRLLPLHTALPDAITLPPELEERQERDRKFLSALLEGHREKFEIPVPLNATLRPYQSEGVSWLAFLRRYGLSGILADDMGLGKTLQSLCILASDRFERGQETQRLRQHSLLVCPTTLIWNWKSEAAKFFSGDVLPVQCYAGTKEERIQVLNNLKHQDGVLLVCAYDHLRRDINSFLGIPWRYCILDEGHVIRNHKSALTRAIKTLTATHRLILTGTPIQNHVLDLWSLFDFLMPGYLGNYETFRQLYAKPILASQSADPSSQEAENGAAALDTLHRQVLPFILRREKSSVLHDLPPKIVQDHYCEMSSLQSELYATLSQDHIEAAERSELDKQKEMEPGQSLKTMFYLRKLCTHPALLLDDPTHPQYSAWRGPEKQQILHDLSQSPKILALKQLLEQCGIGEDQIEKDDAESEEAAFASRLQRHRVLIFCQLKSTIDILERDLFRARLPSISYLRMDGSTPAPARVPLCQKFNSDPSISCFLLSTSAGGLGLNLTGADTVIFMEHDWNPMKDLQAMDRAHRIGATRTVYVYRLIMRDTLEERIMGLQNFKLLVAGSVVNQENQSFATMDTSHMLNSLQKADSNSKVSTETENWEAYEEDFDMSSFLNSLK